MNRFAPRNDQDVLRLVLKHPLMWVVSGQGESFRATLLPIRPLADANGRITTLVGHFARSNDQLGLLKSEPRACLLALGPQGYISPSWMQDRTQAPTWNYASAQFDVGIEFFDDPAEIEAHLRDLVTAMEQGRPRAWTIDDMGARFQSLAKRIVGFRATVHATRAKFKLGQDERNDVFSDIMLGLSQPDLRDWMKEFNSHR